MAGFIKVYTGGMKCGKSDKLFQIAKRKREYAKKNVIVVKPDIDRIFADGKEAWSRDNRREDCTWIPYANPEYIFTIVDNSVDVVIIDEAQFFSTTSQISIVDVVHQLSDSGIEVLIGGLDMTSDRKPFGPMPLLMSIAHEVEKMKSVCECCGSEQGIYSLAKFHKESEIALGDAEYKAVCSDCYKKYKK